LSANSSGKRRIAATPAEPLVAGLDFYLDERGRTVFTAHYNRRRGYCCFLACRHCPWGQAGRTPPEAQADLRGRLEALQARLEQAGLPVRVEGYRNGVLALRADETAPQDEAAVRTHAEGLLTVVALEWNA
jgi:hypothetical protein